MALASFAAALLTPQSLSRRSNDLQKVEAELRAEVNRLREGLEVVPPPPPPPAAPPAADKLKALARKNQELSSTVDQQHSQIQTLTASLAHLKKNIADPTSPAPLKLQPPPAFSPAAKMASNASSGYPPLSSTSVQDIVDEALSQPGDAKKAEAALTSLLNKCNEQKATNAR